MTSLVLLSMLGLSAAAIMPASLSDPNAGMASTENCGAEIAQLEEQVEAAVGSSRVIHFIENNATAYKSLHQKYTLYWINTKYDWKTEVGGCSASLGGITASFQMSNSTVPFLGMAYFGIDPPMTRVVNVHVDMPGFQGPYK
ncbi:MAG TPA: hypothetical protein VJ792_09940 [Candidatus Nitrosotalea sp.]|nr:hypothetical protein [Candidatus Nitrosotalea sp.]